MSSITTIYIGCGFIAFLILFGFAISVITIYNNKKLLIVDDLMTTGATLASLCKELQKIKPAGIMVVVASRTV